MGLAKAAAAAGVIAVLAASRATAGPGRTYDLSRVDRWQSGDFATATVRLAETTRSSTVASGAEALTQTFERTAVSVEVQKCVEADAQGRRTKLLVWWREWSVTTKSGTGAAPADPKDPKDPKAQPPPAAKETKDESLKGAYVQVAGCGRDRKWTVVVSAQEPSDAAKEWLDARYGALSGEDDVAWRARPPGKPVAVGDTWSADSGPLLDRWRAGFPVDREKASLSYRLLSVDDATNSAVVQCELLAPTRALPATKGQPETPWTSGGTLRLKANTSMALAGRVTGGSSIAKTALDGQVTWQGVPMSVSMRMQREESLRIGGEIPEPGSAPKRPGGK
jgi:hypothetical protein